MNSTSSKLSNATIAPANLSLQIYAELKSAILNGNFALGERLSPDELAKHFQVSVMPVRDALKLLETDGLVEILPRRGAFVAQVQKGTVREIFHIRRIIERACVEEVENVSPELLTQLQATLTDMESLRAGQTYRDYPHYVRLDSQFHTLIVSIPSNSYLLKLYEELRWSIQLVLVLSHSASQRAQQTLEEHRAIVDALRTKDIVVAQAAISEHLRNAEEDLLLRIPT